jgi:hypothetical protein
MPNVRVLGLPSPHLLGFSREAGQVAVEQRAHSDSFGPCLVYGPAGQLAARDDIDADVGVLTGRIDNTSFDQAEVRLEPGQRLGRFLLVRRVQGEQPLGAAVAEADAVALVFEPGRGTLRGDYVVFVQRRDPNAGATLPTLCPPDPRGAKKKAPAILANA